ncbi:MAG: hypothetical protein U0894_08545 [Pirellulales bacterium]
MNPHGRDDGSWPRDLLPRADPYIASLLGKLGAPPSQAVADYPNGRSEITLYELAADERLGDDWIENTDDGESEILDEELPKMRPVFGGFPLLDDLDDEPTLDL